MPLEPRHDHSAPVPSGVAPLELGDPEVRVAVNELMIACEDADGHLPFGDHELLAIAHGTSEGHLAFGSLDGSALAGYAHLSRLGDQWLTEVAVLPSHRQRGIGTRLLDAVAAHVKAHDGGTLSTWAYHLDGGALGLSRHIGFRPVRTLYQLRVPTLPDGAPPLPAGFTLDTFLGGRDERDWLVLNAAAFADLPDQGAWTEQDLAFRMEAPWFREDDVLLVRRGGRLIATCWCKIDPKAKTHEGEQLGEIYVIAVHPDAAGFGLGKTLALKGLSHMRTRAAEVGMLYVDARNTRALLLYDSLGFRLNHEDVCLSTTL